MIVGRYAAVLATTDTPLHESLHDPLAQPLFFPLFSQPPCNCVQLLAFHLLLVGFSTSSYFNAYIPANVI